jgi:hypothetical protein
MNKESTAGVPPLESSYSPEEITALKEQIITLTAENKNLKDRLATFEQAANPSLHGRDHKFKRDQQDGV